MSSQFADRVLPCHAPRRVRRMHLVMTVRAEGNGIGNVVGAAVTERNDVVHLNTVAVFADSAHSGGPSKQIIDIGWSKGHGKAEYRRVSLAAFTPPACSMRFTADGGIYVTTLSRSYR